MTFDRFYVYALREDVRLPFEFVVSLSSTATNYRREITTISFVPLIVAGPYADRDPYRVPLQPGQEGGSRIITRLYAAVDAVQSINKAAFLPSDLGRISAVEERELREKLIDWLGLAPTVLD